MRIVNFIVYAIARAFLLGARIIPMEFTFWWVKLLARLAYRFARGRRALMLWNLEYALGDTATPEQREEIAWKSFENMFVSIAEFIHMDSILGRWREHAEFEGAEIVDRLIQEKKGFFVFGGHLGGWTMPGLAVRRFPDCPGFNIVARPLRNPRLQTLFEYMAEKFSGRVITTRGTGEVIEERAAKGELIGFYMDQEGRRDNAIFVDFFGHQALTHVVPGYLAWKNNIPLIPYWIPRTRPGHYRVIFREPLTYELTEDKDENNRRVTQAIAREVERTIREFPEQWLWAHNRWRRRPDGSRLDVFEKEKHGSRTRRRKKGEYLSSEDLAEKNQDREQK